MNITEGSNIGAIVAEDYRIAAVFEKFNLDFCCNGNKSIAIACCQKNIDTNAFVEALKNNLDKNSISGEATNYHAWALDLLSNYIEKKHHRYVIEQIPVLKNYVKKIARVHGNKHPELLEIKLIFEKCSSEFIIHMEMEEKILFPFIRKMVKTKDEGKKARKLPFGSVKNFIGGVMHDHDQEGDAFNKTNNLSNHLDMHLHIHLENNILFQKAIEFESSFI